MFVVQVRNWRSACIPLGVKPIVKPQNILRNMLVHVKEKTPVERKKLQRLCIYEGSCHDCQMKYIGETKRSMKQRVTEHRYAVKKMGVQNGIAAHVQRHQPSINAESARVCPTAKD